MLAWIGVVHFFLFLLFPVGGRRSSLHPRKNARRRNNQDTDAVKKKVIFFRLYAAFCSRLVIRRKVVSSSLGKHPQSQSRWQDRPIRGRDDRQGRDGALPIEPTSGKKAPGPAAAQASGACRPVHMAVAAGRRTRVCGGDGGGGTGRDGMGWGGTRTGAGP